MKYFSPLWAAFYGISLPVSGFFALAYVQLMRKYRQRISFSLLLFTNKHLVVKMRRQRKTLIAALNQVRDEYLSVLSSQRAGMVQTQ
jgi:hypothetical protein